MIRDKSDGMLYEWDKEKNAWFPRIDEDFMAHYQMSYGFDNDGASKPTVPDDPTMDGGVKGKEEEAKKAKKAETEDAAAKKGKKPQWFDDDQAKSTKVYISGMNRAILESVFHHEMAYVHKMLLNKLMCSISKFRKVGKCLEILHRIIPLFLTLVTLLPFVRI